MTWKNRNVLSLSSGGQKSELKGSAGRGSYGSLQGRIWSGLSFYFWWKPASLDAPWLVETSLQSCLRSHMAFSQCIFTSPSPCKSVSVHVSFSYQDTNHFIPYDLILTWLHLQRQCVLGDISISLWGTTQPITPGKMVKILPPLLVRVSSLWNISHLMVSLQVFSLSDCKVGRAGEIALISL